MAGRAGNAVISSSRGSKEGWLPVRRIIQIRRVRRGDGEKIPPLL
jgi:hypothetical protein